MLDILENLLTKVFTLIIDIVMYLCDLLLAPIDILIENYMPSIDGVLDYVTEFFQYILGFIPYILSWFKLPDFFIEFVIAFWVLKLNLPLVIHTTKLAIAWYNQMKV